jgi:hypothetical protein
MANISDDSTAIVATVSMKEILTSSACFWAVLLKPLRESLRQAASCLKESGEGCHAMVLTGCWFAGAGCVVTDYWAHSYRKMRLSSAEGRTVAFSTIGDTRQASMAAESLAFSVS